MTKNSKVLTVSYGTFSCTLEGFDDAFGTMKDIADYFRDLTAEDRFFGADPPQPDTEALAQIIRQNRAPRSDASEEDGKIMLSMDDQTPAAEPACDGRTGHEPQPTLESAAAFFAKSVASPAVAQDGMEEEMSAQDFRTVTALAGVRPRPDTSPASAAARRNKAVAETVSQPNTRSTEGFSEKLDRLRAAVSQQDTSAQGNRYDEDADAPDEAAGFDGFKPTAPTQVSSQNTSVVQAAHDIEEALQADAENEGSADEEADTDDIDAVLRALEAGNTATANDQVPHVIEETTVSTPHQPVPAEDAQPPASRSEGRVLKVNRADLEAALDKGHLKQIDEAAAKASDNAAPRNKPTRSPRVSRKDSQSEVPQIKQSAEDDLSRLMAEADNQMDKPDGQTRRRTFSQLRAAVAARREDQSLQNDAAKRAKDAQAYRSDLADVVRPDRRVSPARHPAGTPPSPLKLVAEQRVDQAQQGARAAARTGDDIGFAAYAEKSGARTVPELLEAAAAYLSCIEGQAQFSRPELMAQIKEAFDSDLSREDGLRYFGQLLRAGKIIKAEGGYFAASDKILRTSERRAGM